MTIGRGFNTASDSQVAAVANQELIAAKTGVIPVITKIFFSTDTICTMKLLGDSSGIIDNFTWYFAANSGLLTVEGIWRGFVGEAVDYTTTGTSPKTSIKIEWFEEYA